MITAAALAVLIAFTPPDEPHPVEVCEMMDAYALAAYEDEADPPVGDELTHIYDTAQEWDRPYPGAFYTACVRGEI